MLRRAFLRIIGIFTFLAGFSGAGSTDENTVAGEFKSNYRTGQKSNRTILALSDPPRCVEAFNVTPVTRKEDLDICARFSLSCKTCDSSALRIWCYPLLVEQEGEFAGISVGDTIERNPHEVECVECGEKHLVFDASKHGYDGELGNGSSYSQGTGQSRPITVKPDEYGVNVIFTYNISPEDLPARTAGNIRSQDLFDWFNIIAISQSGEELKDINYECA